MTGVTAAVRSRGRAVPAALAALIAVTVVVVVQSGQRSSPDELEAFSGGLAPIVQSWGSVEVLGMRAAVGDLRDGPDTGVPAAAIATEARAWQESFAANRRDLVALGVPTGLDDVVELFHASLDRYIDAAAAFEAAATAVAEGGPLDLGPGIDAAADGAELFDRAAALLQAARRSVGLRPDPRLPTDDGQGQG